ncbi:MAG: hypothetical protein VB140_03180, partial [Burkholderia sp.]
VRNPCVSPEIMPVDAIASSHSIYATTPPSMPWRPHVRFMQQRLTPRPLCGKRQRPSLAL